MQASKSTDLLADSAGPDLTEALEHYRAALAEDPRHYWSHFQLGRCYLAMGRRAEAVEAVGTCVALRPDFPWSYSTRGLALALLGFDEPDELERRRHFEQAQRDFAQALRIDPDFRPARLNRGVCYWLQKDPEKAIADFDAALAPPEESRLIEAAYYRGMIHLEQGRLEIAVRDFDQIAAAAPEFRPVYLSRADAHFRLGDDESGLANLTTYLSLASAGQVDADSWQACHRRGRYLRRLIPRLPPARRAAVAKLALGELTRAAERGGTAPDVFHDLGATWHASGRIDEAIRSYSEGLRRAPGDVKLLNLRGAAYATLKDHELARADFTQAIRLDPANPEAYTWLGYIRACTRAPADAQRYAVQSLFHGSNDYLVLHNVACIYAELSRNDPERAGEYEDIALELLRREVQFWREGGRGHPSAIQLIDSEPAFPPSLRSRVEFQELLAEGKDVSPEDMRMRRE